MTLKKSNRFLLGAIALTILALTGCDDYFGGNLGFETESLRGFLDQDCRQDPNDRCNAGLECNDQNKCVTKTPGTDKKGTLGNQCRDTDPKCNAGLVCNATGICEKAPEKGTEGKACRDTDPKCNAGLVCSATGICEKAPEKGTEGKACRDTDPKCNAGLFCDTNICKVIPPGTLGGACQIPGDTCDGILVCDSQTKTCQNPGAGTLNGECRTADPQCDKHLACDKAQNVCKQIDPGKLNGACKGTDPKCDEGQGLICDTQADTCVTCASQGKLLHPITNECVDAQCNLQASPPQNCPNADEFCVEQLCIKNDDRCKLTVCDTGYKCDAGACVLDCGTNELCNGVCCGVDQTCFNGTTCVDKPNSVGGACNLDQVEYCSFATSYCDASIQSCVNYSEVHMQAPATVCLANTDLNYELEEVLTWQGSTDPTIKPFNQVMTTPLAFDGKLIFAGFQKTDYLKAILFVIEGVTSNPTTVTEVWNSQDTNKFTTPFYISGRTTIALGDIDADTKNDGPEIIAMTEGEKGLIAINLKSAEVKWTKTFKNAYPFKTGVDWALSIADINGDGKPEIITPFEVRSGQNGDLLCKYGPIVLNHEISRAPIAVNLDSTGDLEIVGGGFIRTLVTDGSTCPTYGTDYSAMEEGHRFVAVADIDSQNGNNPEIIVSNKCHLYIFNDQNTLITSTPFPEQSSCGTTWYGGAPTVADFDGDGKPEIGVLGRTYFTVYDYDDSSRTLSELWKVNTTDGSGKTGSAAFDFNGDGIAEIVYNDQGRLYMFHGKKQATADAQNILNKPAIINTSGTAAESPIVVDLNNDGSAEIVVATNQWAQSTTTTGLRVFKEKHNRWVGTRRIWNQQAYQPTFVKDDGTIPANPPQYWENAWSNNLHQNPQTTSMLAAELKPELSSITTIGACDGTSDKRRINFRILNDGDKEVPVDRFKTVVSISKAGENNWVVTAAIDKNQGAVPARGSLEAYVDVTLPSTLINESLDIKFDVDSENQVVECNESNNILTETVAANVVSPSQNLALEIESLDDKQCAIDPEGTLSLIVKIKNTGTTAIPANSNIKVDLHVGSGGQFEINTDANIADEIGASSEVSRELTVKIPKKFQGKLLEAYAVVGSSNVNECTMDDNRAEYDQPLLCQ